MDQSKKFMKRAKVLFPFHAEIEDELNVSEGDIVDIIEVGEDGWTVVQNIDTKQKGIIPTEYFELLEEEAQENTSEGNALIMRPPIYTTPQAKKIIAKFYGGWNKRRKLQVEQILGINKTFLDALEKGMINFPQQQSFGTTVKNIAPYFKTYTVYVNNYKTAFDLEENLEKTNAKFRDFLSEQYNKKELSRHKFDSFLIMPVQRLPRYKMLFEQVLKYTPEDHVERTNISEALIKVSEIADFVNTNQKTFENQKVLIGLMSSYKEKYPTLVQPYRQYKAEGNVNLVYPDKKILNQPHVAYLFTDMLILLEAKKKKNIYFVVLAYSTIGRSDGPCELRLDALHEGAKRQINLTFQTDTEKSTWEQLIIESVQNEMKNIENKGIKYTKDLLGFGKERIDLCGAIEDKKTRMNQIGKEFANAQQSHFKLETEIINHERQLEELMKKIAQEKDRKSKLEEGMFSMHQKHKEIKDEMVKNLVDIVQRDTLYAESLKNETYAFLSTFNEKPMTKEDQEALLVKFPPLQLPRLASQRMSMTGPKKELPPTPPPKGGDNRGSVSIDTKSAPPLPVNRRQSMVQQAPSLVSKPGPPPIGPKPTIPTSTNQPPIPLKTNTPSVLSLEKKPLPPPKKK